MVVVLGVLGAIAGIAIAVAPPDSRGSVARLALVVGGVIVAWWLLRRSAAVTASSPERFDAGLRQPEAARSEIPSLRAVQNTLALTTASAIGSERRMKPLLRELAAWKLMRNRGIDLDASPIAARVVLGEPLWASLQGTDAPIEHGAPGIPLGVIQASLEQLEQI